MLRQQEELENGAAWSISSESSDDSSSPQLSGSARHAPPRPIVQPAVQATAPAIEIAFTQPEDREPPTLQEEVVVVANGHVPYARTLSQISEASVDIPAPEDRECTSPRALPPLETNSSPQAVNSVSDIQINEGEEPEAEFDGAAPVAVHVEDTVGQAQEAQSSESTLSQPTALSDVPRPKVVDCGLEDAISALTSALDDYRGQFPELQTLEQEVKHLEEIVLVSKAGGGGGAARQQPLCYS